MLTGATHHLKEWSEAEDEALRQHYPTVSWAELAKVLPGRNHGALHRRAWRLGVKRLVKTKSEEALAKQAARLKANPPRTGKVIYPVIERNGVKGKFCRTCSEWRPLEKFGTRSDGYGMPRSDCTTCEGRLAYEGNPDARKRAVRKWQAAHPEKYREIKNAARNRRHKRKMLGPGISVAEYRELMALFGGLCAYCRVEKATTMDHVIPLSRGGLHEARNLLPACKGCNFEKHDKTPAEWAALKEA